MFETLLGRQPIIGLDIGSHGVKLVALKGRKADKRQLIGLGVQNLSPEVIVDGAIMNSDAVSQAIGEVLATQQKKLPKHVGTSLSGSSVIIKLVPMPKMSRDDLARNIQHEAAEHIPYPMDEVNVDFVIVGDDPDEPDRMTVFLVAAKKDMINEYNSALIEAGLKPTVLDVDSFAVGNAFEFNYPELVEETVALVNIGAAVTNVNVVRGGVSLFVRDITMGGYQVTEDIQKSLGVSFEEAEVFKRGGSAESDALIPEEVGTIIRDASQAIASSIQQSLNYYTQLTGREDITRVFLSGGMSMVSGMERIIEETTSHSVEILNPFRHIVPAAKGLDLELMENSAPLFAVAVGLALREGGDQL